MLCIKFWTFHGNKCQKCTHRERWGCVDCRKWGGEQSRKAKELTYIITFALSKKNRSLAPKSLGQLPSKSHQVFRPCLVLAVFLYWPGNWQLIKYWCLVQSGLKDVVLVLCRAFSTCVKLCLPILVERAWVMISHKGIWEGRTRTLSSNTHDKVKMHD